MQLGDIISRLEDETVADQALLELGDLVLTARVAGAAAREAMTRGEFVAACVRTFAARASDEEWLTMLGQMGRSEGPGEVLLRRALDAGLRQSPV